jgi:hypothetical protein
MAYMNGAWGGEGGLCDFYNYDVGRAVRSFNSRYCKLIPTELTFYVCI